MAITYINKIAKERGLRKVSARRPLQIEVTKNDVDRATSKNSKCCAFACAAQRLPKVKAAYFFLSTAWLEYDDRLVRYQLPQTVQKEIVHFDRAHSMEPGVYQLSKVARSNTAKAKRALNAKARKRDGSRGKSPNRTIAIRHKTANVRSMFEPRDQPPRVGRRDER